MVGLFAGKYCTKYHSELAPADGFSLERVAMNVSAVDGGISATCSLVVDAKVRKIVPASDLVCMLCGSKTGVFGVISTRFIVDAET